MAVTCIYIAPVIPKNPQHCKSRDALYVSLTCNFLNSTTWQLFNAHRDLGMKGGKWSQPMARWQNKRHSEFLSTKTFSTVLPSESVPSGHCHAEQGWVFTRTKSTEAFVL